MASINDTISTTAAEELSQAFSSVNDVHEFLRAFIEILSSSSPRPSLLDQGSDLVDTLTAIDEAFHRGVPNKTYTFVDPDNNEVLKIEMLVREGGNENGGDEVTRVLRLSCGGRAKYIRYTAWYSSYEGIEWDVDSPIWVQQRLTIVGAFYSDEQLQRDLRPAPTSFTLDGLSAGTFIDSTTPYI